MEKLINTCSPAAAVFGGLCAKVLGGWDILLYALRFLICCDYITGIVKGVCLKNLSSALGFRGLLKKLTILVVVAVANVVQSLLGDTLAIREIVMMFFIANEGLSVLENIAAVGTRIPKPLQNVLLQLREKQEEDTKQK